MHHIENKQNSDIQKLQDDLESQYGPAVAQDIADRLRKSGNVARAPDYMDVKAMSELQEKFRGQAMMAVWRLKEWRKAQDTGAFQKNLVQLEGVFLQRQCEDAIKLYRLATTSYFRMYEEAMTAILNKDATSSYSPLLAQRSA